MPNAVSHPEKISPFVAAMDVERVRLAGLSDSNQVFNGSGHDEGCQAGLLASGKVMYATGLMTQTYGGSSVEVGHQYACSGNKFLENAGAPAELAALFTFSNGLVIQNQYSYKESGAPFEPWAQVMQLLAGSPIGNASRLRCHVQVALFTTGAGSYRHVVRIEASPFNEIAADPQVRSSRTQGDEIELIDDYFDVHGDPTRTQALGWRLCGFGVGSDIVAPVWFGWKRIENRDKAFGFSYSTLCYLGGSSLRDAALALQNSTDAALDNWFQHFAFPPNESHAPASPKVLFDLIYGVNDQNQTALSVGPNPAPTHTPEGRYDNTQAIVTRLLEVAERNGVPAGDVYFMLNRTHPQGTAVDSVLATYSEADVRFAADHPNCTAYDVSKDITPAEMQSNGWWNIGTDKPHMSAPGYTAYHTRRWASILEEIEAIPEPGAPTPYHTGYQSPVECEEIIKQILPATHRLRKAFEAASDETRGACIELATTDLDAVRWEGVRQVEEQLFAWPRYERTGSTRALGGLDPNATGLEQTAGLPLAVRRAHALQTAHHCNAAAGLDPMRFLREMARVGVTSQSGGGQSQVIDLKTASNAWAALCIEAQQQVRNFRISGGSFV